MRKNAIFCFFITVILACPSAANEKTVEIFLRDASLDAWNPVTNEVLFMRRNADNIWQLYKVKADAQNPEEEKESLSLDPTNAIGVEASMIPLLHKGASDWHPSGSWFITEMEIPYNISWRFETSLPSTRLLAEPGAGWWNNLFLVKSDGSLWIRLTNFTASDLESGVLYPKFSKDGKMVVWAERIGGAKPFDKYPFARWVLKTAKMNWEANIPYLFDRKTHPLRDGAIFEPQEWGRDNKLLFAADIDYSDLPYPAYRIDIWEAEVSGEGEIKSLKNLTRSSDSYEEQSAYSPDGKLISFMANLFDRGYERRLTRAWRRHKTKSNNFIIKNLFTDLYLMNRNGKVLERLTYFVEKDWQGHHPLVTRSAWSKDGKTLLIAVTLRSNITGKKVDESIYKLIL